MRVYYCRGSLPHVSSVRRPGGFDEQGNPKPDRCFFCPAVVIAQDALLRDPIADDDRES